MVEDEEEEGVEVDEVAEEDAFSQKSPSRYRHWVVKGWLGKTLGACSAPFSLGVRGPCRGRRRRPRGCVAAEPKGRSVGTSGGARAHFLLFLLFLIRERAPGGFGVGTRAFFCFSFSVLFGCAPGGF